MYDTAFKNIESVGGIPMITLEPFTGNADEDKKGDVLEKIKRGEFDGQLSNFLTHVQNYSNLHPEERIKVRFAHEMNGPWYPWGQRNPKLYEEAFLHFASMIKSRDLNGTVSLSVCINNRSFKRQGELQIHTISDYLTTAILAEVDTISIDGYIDQEDIIKAEGDKSDLMKNVYGDAIDKIRVIDPSKPINVTEFGVEEKKLEKQATLISQAIAYFKSKGVEEAYLFLGKNPDINKTYEIQ